MKNFFFLGISLFVVLVGGGYAVWLLLKALGSVYDDWREGRESQRVRADRAAAAERKRKENEDRLDNGCEHVFDDAYGAFPPGVCCKCGIEKAKPIGYCDHRWKRIEGPVPGSTCEKCGKRHPAGERPG